MLIPTPAAKALCECAEAVAIKQGKAGAAVGYEEIAEAAFGPFGRLLVSSIIYVELFGTCALLFILEVRARGGGVNSIRRVACGVIHSHQMHACMHDD